MGVKQWSSIVAAFVIVATVVMAQAEPAAARSCGNSGDVAEEIDQMLASGDLVFLGEQIARGEPNIDGRSRYLTASYTDNEAQKAPDDSDGESSFPIALIPGAGLVLMAAGRVIGRKRSNATPETDN